jgi:hypothetical protein
LGYRWGSVIGRSHKAGDAARSFYYEKRTCLPVIALIRLAMFAASTSSLA